jgi:peptidyl-Asp metalloendopeptidase
VGNQTTDWQVAAIGDYNGDGYSDILWRNPLNGANSIWEMNASGGHSIVNPGTLLTSYQVQS